jgi:hypothetical protein
MTIATVALLDGSNCASTGTGSTITVEGQPLNYTCGSSTTGLIGDFNTSQPLWTAEKVVLTQANPPTVQTRSTVGIGSVNGVPPTTAPAPTPAPAPAPGPAPAAPPQVRDERYFPETNFRIANDAFWNFFQSRGAIETFGFPVSRQFGFLGCPVQIFQRLIMQQCGASAPVTLVNMLDPDIFPYTRVNGSVFPEPDEQLKQQTPAVGTPEYANILPFIQANTPDTFNGQPVNFWQTFMTHGGLEILGAPISHPQPDPTNNNFIYQRFQRVILHFHPTVGGGTVTEPLLLADYLKQIILGPTSPSLPQDLAQQSSGSRFYAQYCRGALHWLCRPDALGGTDLTFAFERG